MEPTRRHVMPAGGQFALVLAVVCGAGSAPAQSALSPGAVEPPAAVQYLGGSGGPRGQQGQGNAILATRQAPIGVSDATELGQKIRKVYGPPHGRGATNDPVRRGCLGSHGEAPMLSRVKRRDTAHLTLHLQGPPAAAAVILLGTAAAPVDLTSLGAPGCELRVHASIFIPVRTDGAGRSAVRLSSVRANAPTLAQAVIFDANANAIGITLTRPLEISAGDGFAAALVTTRP